MATFAPSRGTGVPPVSPRIAVGDASYNPSLAARLSPLLLDISHQVADGLNALGNIVGNGNIEFFVKFHDEFHQIERIRAEVGQGGVRRDPVERDTKDV